MAIDGKMNFRAQGRSSTVVNQYFNRILQAMIAMGRGTVVYEVMRWTPPITGRDKFWL
jgi:hypothetical protein